MSPEVQAERDRCAAICETVARNWQRSADEARAEGSYTVRQIWPWKLVTVVRPGWERSAKSLEAAAQAMRTVKEAIQTGARPPPLAPQTAAEIADVLVATGNG